MYGPNYVWHCDGYDKLKPYGFAIHGCMDGMCVVVGFTSVASFFSVYISSFPAKHVSCPVGSYYIQVFSQKPVASCRGDKQ